MSLLQCRSKPFCVRVLELLPSFGSISLEQNGIQFYRSWAIQTDFLADLRISTSYLIISIGEVMMVIIVCHCIIYKGGSECNLLLLLLLDKTHTLHKFSATAYNNSAFATCIIFCGVIRYLQIFCWHIILFADQMSAYSGVYSGKSDCLVLPKM